MTEEGPEHDLTDLHSHLVPGVDDGARDLDDALEGVGRMVDRGIRTIVTTPHLAGSLTLDPQGLEERLTEVDAAFEAVERAVRERYPDVSFMRGHEVMLDRPEAHLEDPRIRLGDSRVVLAEWPRLRVPPGTARVLRALREQGVQIMIAHPERYGGYDEQLSAVEEWRAEGAFLQINYGSFTDRYGPRARLLAFRLLERGWVDCLASDFHGREHLRLYVNEAREVFRALDAEESWTLLSSTNPGRIARGEEPLLVPPVESSRGFLERLRALFRA